MLSSPVPHDVLCLIKDQIDPTLIGPHLALSNVSRSFRSNLYPHGDKAWKGLLTSMGIGRSLNDLEGKPIKKSRTWRSIAVEVAHHEKEGTCKIVGDPYADEGTEMLCPMTRGNNYRVTKHPHRVFSVEAVRKEKVQVLAHPQLGNDFDCHNPGSDILRLGPWRGDEENKIDEKVLLVKSHPVLCHSSLSSTISTDQSSFFVSTQAIAIGGFNLAVSNPEGVTQWDVRVMMNTKFPYITQAQYKKHYGRTYKEDMECCFGGAEKLDKKTKVKLTDFMFGPDRVFNGDIDAERGSCLFEVGSDS